MIQTLFISNGFWLTDFFHRSHVWINKAIHDSREADSDVKTRYRDTYEFDLGYH